MHTRDLVSRLAANLHPVAPNAVSRSLGRALVSGLVGNIALLVALYGVRSDMPELILTGMFWVRLAFPAALIVTATRLAERLARPGAPFAYAWLAVALPIVTMLAVTAGILLATPPGYRLQLVLGSTWQVTTADIVFLSLPSLAVMMRAMKKLAPTRLALAGASAGFLAGAQGGLVYSLYCSEMSVPFWGVWYVLAIAMTACIGATVGPRYLRW
ncbi:DUF1109 domain-containing protein [Burkholderia catarinensis]|uniref:DUF1109 domain-containing protein n=1 Tax=Burkholderia catarinensis TaxID=1108140 RepID=UPI000915F744|nr:DUF1109 domain-containing protein [Burkholderia catarinensis]KAG8151526.1 hypothetical protein BFF94_021675 [Burkholderia catarinensis]